MTYRKSMDWLHEPAACRLAVVAALTLLPFAAHAQLAVTAAAQSQYEYNSNVFDLPKPLPAGLTLPEHATPSDYSDSFYSYGAKLDASYLWSQQQFYATAQDDEFRYDRFTQLNHNEYNLDGGWDWRLGALWDGVLDVTRIRSQVFFYNTGALNGANATTLILQTEQRETARVGLQATPDWRAEITGLTHQVDQPQTTTEQLLTLHETSGEGAIKYTGVAGVTAGVAGTYLKGSYSGAGIGTYTQTSGALTATDIVTGLSTFRGQVGYSSRTSGTGFNSISGVTGELFYQRSLTGKTTVSVDLTRAINAYIANEGSEIDSIAALTANWQATYTIGVVLGYNYTYRQLPDQGEAPNGIPDASERLDRLNLVSLSVTYQPVDWLILRPFAQYQDRTSRNYVGGDFNASAVGLAFTLQLQRGTIPPRTLLTP